MILDFFPENALGDGPKNSRIRVKLIFHKINENLESDFVQDPQDVDDGPDDDDEDEFVPEDEV